MPSPPAPPPRLAPVVLAGAAAFIDLYATQPLLPFLARAFHATTLEVSLTVTASTFGVAVAAPFAGRLADRVGRKRVIVGAAFALAAATLLAATSVSLWQLIAWRFVQGVFTPGVFAVTIAYIHEQWPASSAGQATAGYVSGTVVGGFSGRLIAGVVAADASWRAAFVVLGLLNAAAALLIAARLPADARADRVRSGRSRIRAVLGLIRNPQLASAYAAGFGVLFSLVAMFTYVTFLLAAPPYRLSTVALGSVFFVYLIGAAITPFVGPVIDRYGHRYGMAVAVAFGIAGALTTLGGRLPVILAGLTLCSTDPAAVCSRTLACARDVRSRIAGLPRAAETDDPIRFGLALHVGEVMYGNIGGGNRLDFTCIGPAVNLAARLEKVASKLGETVVASADFAGHFPDEFRRLGEHAVAGFAAPQAVFGLAA